MKANVGIENSSRKYLIESQEELIRAVKYEDMIAEGVRGKDKPEVQRDRQDKYRGKRA